MVESASVRKELGGCQGTVLLLELREDQSRPERMSFEQKCEKAIDPGKIISGKGTMIDGLKGYAFG